MISKWTEDNKELVVEEVRENFREICKDFYVKLYAECAVREIPEEETMKILKGGISAVMQAHLTTHDAVKAGSTHEMHVEKSDIHQNFEETKKLLIIEDQLENGN